ncbi:MAG: DMT family transporter [Actinomycetota bacterium]|nr:DMT family transporter [Actinomycetota bacterium]
MRRAGYLLVAGAIVLFGTIEVVSKYLQSGPAGQAPVGSTQVAALRFLIGAAFMFLLLPLRGQQRLVLSALRESGMRIAALGAVGVFLTFFLLHEGIDRTSASVAAVIFSMNPVFTALVAALALRERLGAAGWLGVLLGLLGAFAAVTDFHFAGLFARGDFLGGMMVLGSALTWSVYSVYGKRYSERFGGLAVSFLTMAAGSFLLAALLTVTGGWGEMASYGALAWWWLLYLGAVTVGLGYLLYFEGLRRVPASRGASLFYLKPVLALLCAHLFLGEPVSYRLLAASLLVAAGILLVALTREHRQTSPGAVLDGPGDGAG